jgi:type II secretory pathway component PulF
MTQAQKIRCFYRELYNLLNVGVPILASLRIIEKDLGNSSFGAIIRRIADDIEQSETKCLSEAMRQTAFFSETEVCLIHAGEVGGVVESVISRLIKMDSPKAQEYDRFWVTFYTCLTCGVPFLEAIHQASAGCTTGLAWAMQYRIIEGVGRRGSSMAEAMEKSGVFSTFEIEIVKIGEETGSFDTILSPLGEKCLF